jgi:hypothetical protein
MGLLMLLWYVTPRAMFAADNRMNGAAAKLSTTAAG